MRSWKESLNVREREGGGRGEEEINKIFPLSSATIL